MSRKVDQIFFDINEAAQDLQRFVDGKTLTDLKADRLLEAAIERQFEIIGEALNRLSRESPEEFASFPDADRIVGMRNIIAHGYHAVDPAILVDAAQLKLPGLIDHVARRL